ncbi:MAG: MCP four helix bundle domain-containing protein, partial [Pseudomonadota bacterium]
MKIRTRLILGMGSLLIIMVIIGTMACLRIDSIRNHTSELYQHPFTVTYTSWDFIESVQVMHKAMKDIALAKGPQALPSLLAKVNAKEEEGLEELKVMEERFLGDKQEIVRLRQNFISWREIRQRVIALKQQGLAQKAGEITTSRGNDKVESIIAQTQSILNFASKRAKTFFNSSIMEASKSYRLVVVSLALAVLMGLFLVIWITWSLVSPLTNIINFSRQIQSGHYQERLKLGRTDEIGDLSGALDFMADSIEKHTNHLEQLVQERTSELEATNQQLRASDQQLRAANQQLTASEQHLKAVNQQLRASEQQSNQYNDEINEINLNLQWHIAGLKS